MLDFDLQYQQAIKLILDEGIDVPNPWSGRVTRMVPGVTLRVDVEKSFPLLTLRKIPLKLFVAEQVFFLTGEKHPAWLQQFTPAWNEFIEADGTISAAYGYRWRHHFGRDQMEQLVVHLTDNPQSRHGVIVTWDPASDGLGVEKKKNVPCPYTFTVNIAGGRLHLHNIIRSNDMILGCPHDAAGFSLLQCILAQKLGVRPGIYTHSISNAHIYDNHFEAAREIVKRSIDHAPVVFSAPLDSYERAKKGDVVLVDEILASLKKTYQPLEGVGKLDITVNVY